MKSALILLALIASPVYAQTGDSTTISYGSWFLITANDHSEYTAGTMVDNDKFLVYRCYPAINKCMHVLELATTCEKGRQYPVLVNSNISAVDILCTCQADSQNLPTELVPAYDAIHDVLIKASGHIGFAVPMASGLFKVVRFDLTGAADAIHAAESKALKKDSAEYH